MDWSHLEMCWRDPAMKQEAEKRLLIEMQSSRDPFWTTVDLLDQCLKHIKGRPSKTPMIILNILEKLPRCDNSLNQEIKMAALTAALRQRNPNVFNKVCALYHLSDNALDFLPAVRSLIESKKFNEACLLTTALKLQKYFGIQEMVVPLFLQDKMQNAEIYLEGHRELQAEFIQFLDGLLVDSRKPFSVASSLSVPDVKSEKLHPKTIGKLIARLLKKYDIAPDSCPNLCQVRGMGALKYLVNRRFSEGTVDNENWSDLLLGAVGENRELQKELVSLLVTYNEAQEALKWALHFQVERHLWPPILEDLLIQKLDQETVLENCDDAGPPAPQESQQDEVWELEETAYLPFRLQRSDIVLVETEEDFMKCISEIQNYDVLAVDGEWKPSFGMQQEKLSLLQLAVWDSVFLLDIQALVKVLKTDQWLCFIDQVICNSEINKLSYGFTSDLQQLSRIVPSARTKLLSIKNMFDFSILYPKFQAHCPELLVSTGKSGRTCPQDSRGLSSLTWTILGLPLDKSMQFSDWDKRPLREPQVLYAALDAYCLLQIFEVWHQRASDLGQSFFTIAQKATASQPSSSTSPQKGKTQKQKEETPLIEQIFASTEKWDHSKPTVSVTEVRLVVDTMLQGLGKHLRICGIDTHILETDDYHDEAAKVAQRDGRVILTSGAPYQQLRQHVPKGHCLDIPNGLTAQEQAQIVFRHFNIRLQKEDIFSRCSACNGNQYVHIPSQVVHQMWQNHKKMMDWGRPTKDRQPLVAYPGGSVDIGQALIGGKVPIGLHQLNPPVFERVSVFFVCASCGKVYWEGSHHGRVVHKLQPLLNATNSTHESEPEMAGVTGTSDSVSPSLTASSQNSTGVQGTSGKSSLPPPPEMYSDDDEYDDDDYDNGSPFYM